jgi:hypothetical protein
MTLAAATVVDALAARLATQAGLGTGGIKTSRLWPWAEAELPACRIFAAEEVVELVSLDAPINQHTLAVDAQYTVRAVANLDDAMHALASSGLTLMFAGALPYGLQLTGITRNTATEGDAAVGVITLQLSCTYHVAPGAPDTIL